MAELVANCPRCDSQQITFDAKAANAYRQEYGWQNWYEVFCLCRHCHRTTIFVVSESVNGDYDHVHKVGLLKVDGALNRYVNVEGHIGLKDEANVSPPDHVPKEVAAVFNEGAMCLAIGCNNAAGAMFRLCVDLTTRSLLPTEDVEGLNAKVRRDLGLRLPWLFDHGHLPIALRDLSSCIREDGNDAAHAGNLTKADAEDLLDFTTSLLERIYTEPTQLALAQERRNKRRGHGAK